MSEILPLWKSHYSIGRSILTLEKAGSSTPSEPDSIIDLCIANKIKDVYLVEDGFSSFLEAYTNCKEKDLNLKYGLRITVCGDMTDKSEESFSKSCKYVIFIKNSAGYKRLIKLYALASRVGFYYEPRLDFKTLKDNWDENELLLAIPFYDSFIHNNNLKGSLCVPEFDSIKPVFFLEDNEVPFDFLIRDRVKEYCGDTYQTIESKSIYYKTRADFLSFLTFKCINNRSVLSKPQLEHFCSSEFCLQSYLEKL